jgi:hypothetical protein
MKPTIESILLIFAVGLMLLVAAAILIVIYFAAAWLMAEFPQITALLLVVWFCYAFLKDIV